jgi:hypothetical protein
MGTSGARTPSKSQRALRQKMFQKVSFCEGTFRCSILHRQMNSVDMQLQTMSSVPLSSGPPTQPRREAVIVIELLDMMFSLKAHWKSEWCCADPFERNEIKDTRWGLLQTRVSITRIPYSPAHKASGWREQFSLCEKSALAHCRR